MNKLDSFIDDSPSGATFSDCQRYRYSLWRRWDDHDLCAFVGLNPSTADATQDDPTIRRCIGFAKSWGFSGMVMLNLFAFRATDPKDMKKSLYPVGGQNDAALLALTESCKKVICCWGVHGSWCGRDVAVHALLKGKTLFHLGQTKSHHPKHPLYLAASTEPSEIWF